MLTKPDFEHKKTLFINTLSAESDYGFKILAHTFCQIKDGQVIAKTPLSQLFAVIIIGNCTITTPLLKTCREYGINLLLLSKTYALQGEILATAEGNYELRGLQYTRSKEEELSLARAILYAKLANQARMLKKYGYAAECTNLQHIMKKISGLNTIQDLMGYEGVASKLYFQALFKPYSWLYRAPKTKIDITNVLMDMGYTYLMNMADALLRAFGFDTYKGVYHQLFFKRKSLACDVMEPFRVIIDEAILKAYRLKEIHQKDFEIQKNGTYTLKYDKQIQQKYAKILLEALNDNKLFIYAFVLGYYRHIMNENVYTFPKAQYPSRTTTV